MSILNIGTQALQANQTVLQTTGNNIANVNTPGYSRQKVILQTVAGQYTGGGFIGKGVSVQTITRDFSEFLTRQAAVASATQSADTTRADKLKQLEGIFQGGKEGLGAAISDMMNAFSDVANAPTDLTARTVVLTRVDETAARMRESSTRLDDLQNGIAQELKQKASAVNSLAKNIAAVNEQISRAQGSGQPPNDLLDKRNQLIKDLNQYVQTTQIAADDGSLGIYIAGSQELVLGSSASTVAIVADDFGDARQSKLAITKGGNSTTLDENTLGGGEISGLLRFQNDDLNEGRNLLGRITLAVSSAMNDQHKLGLDLDGNPGGNLFTPSLFNTQNVLQPKAPATLNQGTVVVSLSIADNSKFAASDYEVQFSNPTSGSNGTITRKSDGMVTNFDFATTNPVVLDGLNITFSVGGGASGDRFLIKPFTNSASNISSVFSTPRALAVASPVAGKMGVTNTGSLQQVALNARSNPPANVPVTLSFTSATTYTRSDQGATVFNYTPGTAIESSLAAPLADWSLTLQGAPRNGDTFTVDNNTFVKLSGGNAKALMNIRDVAMFDGAAMTDGYAGMISQIGIRTQSATYAAEVSDTIASNAERERTGVSGVNLDEEAAKLLQYQQAYQASAKMIQVSSALFDTIIRTMNG